MEKFSTQIKLILIIFGDMLSPDEITNLIEIHPTNFWIKGDPIPIQKGLLRKDNKVPSRQESAWEFSTGFTKTLDIEFLLDQFEKVFENKIFILKDYIKERKLEISLNIIVEIADTEIPGIHFNKRIIKLCENLGAEIDIDLYLLNND